MIKSFAERMKREIDEHALSDEVRGSLHEWLAADAAFNTWFLVTTKRALGDEELMELLDGYRESQELVEEAWETFQDTKDAARLLEGIGQSIHRMRALQDDA